MSLTNYSGWPPGQIATRLKRKDKLVTSQPYPTPPQTGNAAPPGAVVVDQDDAPSRLACLIGTWALVARPAAGMQWVRTSRLSLPGRPGFVTSRDLAALAPRAKIVPFPRRRRERAS